MTFSLIVPTVGRAEELGRFLDSLALQDGIEFEVIIVDQNPDERISQIVERYPALDLKHLRCERGLSRARNKGLEVASKDVVAFPDDDCWYPEGFLASISRALEDQSVDGVSTMARDDSGNPCGGANWDIHGGQIDRTNVWRRAISIGVFFRLAAARAAGGFDEMLGAGSGTPFGAGEETDFVLRLLAQGKRIVYIPELAALHPPLRRGDSAQDIQRAYSYGMGLGYVVRRHGYPVSYAAKGWIRSAGGMVLSMIKLQPMRARFYRAALMGKVNGWRAGATA